MSKQSVTRAAMLSLALALGLGASALADGPPAKRPAPAVKKASAKKPPVAVSKPSATAPETPKAMVERACVACHDMGNITQSRHTAAEWPGVVQRMRANGADLNDNEVKAIQAYLAKTYSTKR